MTVHTATAATLVKLWPNVQAGDTIELTGDFPLLSISKRLFDQPIVIRSKGASIRQVAVVNSAGLVFDGVPIDFTPDATTTHAMSAFRCVGSQRVVVRNSPIKGGPAVNGVGPLASKLDATMNVLGRPAGRAMTFDTCSDIDVEGNDISLFHKGIVLNKVDGLTIENNDIYELRTTPISGATVDNAAILGNRCHTSRPWNFGGAGDHGDFVHLWTESKYQSGPSRNITIEGNFFEQRDGLALLGIYLDDNGQGLGFADVLIEENVIANANTQAVRLERVQGVVRNNTLMTPTDMEDRKLPAISLYDGSDVDVTGNIAWKVNVDATSTARQSGNLPVARKDYAATFTNGLAAQPTLEDLRTVAGIEAGALRHVDQPVVEPRTITVKAGETLIIKGI